MILIIIFLACALIIIAFIAVSNVLLLPRLRSLSFAKDAPFVSLLVPARNEAAVIQTTVSALLAQTYPNFELLILDDSSADGTGSLARIAGEADTRLQVLDGVPLPEGWTGKNHACHVLARHAQGDILVFTDADTVWQPEALTALIAYMLRSKADLATVWPTQLTLTWSERLVVPLMMFAIIGYLPILMVHFSPFAIFAAANGQCMAWRRAAYQHSGGHVAVASNVLDDVTLARIAKQNGLRLRMLDGARLIGCRMYQDWGSVRAGFAKNILAGYGSSVLALLLATLFHWLVFIAPYTLLFIPAYQVWGVALVALGILTRALTAVASRQRIYDAALMPVSVMLMTWIALQAIYWRFTGGTRWKGRTLPRPLRSASHG